MGNCSSSVEKKILDEKHERDREVHEKCVRPYYKQNIGFFKKIYETQEITSIRGHYYNERTKSYLACDECVKLWNRKSEITNTPKEGKNFYAPHITEKEGKICSLCGNKDAEIEKKNNEITNLKNSNNILLKNIKDLNDQINKLSKENQDMKKLNSVKENELKMLNDKINLYPLQNKPAEINILSSDSIYKEKYNKISGEIHDYISKVESILRFKFDTNRNSKVDNSILNKNFELLDKALETSKIPIDENLIVSNKPNTNFFICEICSNIVIKPVSCTNCNKLICTECLNDCLQINNECPMCKIFPFIPKKIDKLIYNMICDIVITCPYKCRTSISYENLMNHISNCPYKAKIIKCRGCSMELIVLDNNKSILSAHLKDCNNLTEYCIFCNQNFPQSNADLHFLKHCENKIIECNLCSGKYPRKMQEIHKFYLCDSIIELKKIQERIIQ